MKAARTFYITGTDTCVGKTVLTVLLTRCLLREGLAVRAIKPFCSGGRADARALRAAQGNVPSLDEVNPWHYRAAVAPLLAARQERLAVHLAQAVSFVRDAARGCEVLLVEGAGGLLTPLGEGFSNRELLIGLRAVPIVVAANRLGAINQVRLALAALPKRAARQRRLVLMTARRGDRCAEGNIAFLRECTGPGGVQVLPWMRGFDGQRPELRGELRKIALDLIGG